MKLKNDINSWIIYKIVNPKGRVYIGKTNNYPKRLGDYRHNNCKNQILLHRSLVKYGFENHSVEILEQFTSTNEYVVGKELFWIRSYMSNYSRHKEQNGLNLTDGGEGRLGYYHSEETKKKLSEHFKKNPIPGFSERRNTPEQVQKIRETRFARHGNKHSRVYKPRPKRIIHWRVGVSPSNKGVPLTQDQKNHLTSVLTGMKKKPPKKFEGTPEERKIRFGAHNIGNKYNLGRHKSEETRDKIREKIRRPILQYSLSGEFIKEYDSIKNASIDLKMSNKTILLNAQGKVLNPVKYIFKYK